MKHISHSHPKALFSVPLRPAAPAPVQPPSETADPRLCRYGPHHLSPKMFMPVVSTAEGPLICSQLLSIGVGKHFKGIL